MNEKNISELVNYSVEEYIKQLSKVELIEERIESMLIYMKTQLSHGEIHPLSRFWKMRKYCLDHFKEQIPVAKRLRLWKEYCTTIDEIIKLKEMIDEKSTYERDQIENALSSIFRDIENIEKIIDQEPTISVPKNSALAPFVSFYTSTQKALSIYSTYAKRLNALKKEILSLDISYKRKQEILDQIHLLADKVFPEKRRLLNLMSTTYIQHVQQFVTKNFSSDHFKSPIYQLKEQIKHLQIFAKTVSLNVEAFSKTRDQLSKCWDQLKVFEKQHKKEKEEKKEFHNQRFNDLSQKIESLKKKADSTTNQKFLQEINSLSMVVKKEDLLKFQKKQLLDAIDLLTNDMQKEDLEQGSDSFEALTNKLSEILTHIPQWDYQTIDSKLKSCLNKYEMASLPDYQQIKIERSIFSIKEALFAKLQEELNNDVNMDEIIDEIENFRRFVKASIDNYRKALSGSNQSIEKAMVFNELLVSARKILTSLEERLSRSSN